MSDGIEDNKIEKLISAKRHKELTEKLEKVAIALSKKTEDKKDGILEAIVQQTESINQLGKSISSIPKPETPTVNVEVNQEKVISSIVDLEKCIDKILKGQEEILNELKLLNQPKEWEFDVKRNQYTQTISSVTATMNYTKPKYQA